LNIETWFLFFIAYLVITLAPGPNVLFVVKNALRHGYSAAFVSILGNLSCQLLLVILVAAGAGALLAQAPVVFFALKVIGGCYLIYLGVSGLLACRKSAKQSDQTSCELKHNALAIYKKGFLVSASNPKTVIFLSAFLPQFISITEPVALQFSVMFITIAVIVSTVHLLYSSLSKNISHRLAQSQLKKHFSKVYNSAFIAFGGALLMSNRNA
jgi:threonine/homoserine/homoserine lactone efflux protein